MRLFYKFTFWGVERMLLFIIKPLSFISTWCIPWACHGNEQVLWFDRPRQQQQQQQQHKGASCHCAWQWANCRKAGSRTEPESLIWPQWHVWLVRARGRGEEGGWLDVGGGGTVGRRGGGPLLWQRRTNINLLQQSIFHHTYSQGTSQSGLYPFCQWLPSSINFIENYTPDRCSSRPLSICRGAAAEVVVGAWGAMEGGQVHHCVFSEVWQLLFFFFRSPPVSQTGWLTGGHRKYAIHLIRPFIFYAP